MLQAYRTFFRVNRGFAAQSHCGDRQGLGSKPRRCLQLLEENYSTITHHQQPAYSQLMSCHDCPPSKET